MVKRGSRGIETKVGKRLRKEFEMTSFKPTTSAMRTAITQAKREIREKLGVDYTHISQDKKERLITKRAKELVYKKPVLWDERGKKKEIKKERHAPHYYFLDRSTRSKLKFIEKMIGKKKQGKKLSERENKNFVLIREDLYLKFGVAGTARIITIEKIRKQILDEMAKDLEKEVGEHKMFRTKEKIFESSSELIRHYFKGQLKQKMTLEQISSQDISELAKKFERTVMLKHDVFNQVVNDLKDQAGENKAFESRNKLRHATNEIIDTYFNTQATKPGAMEKLSKKKKAGLVQSFKSALLLQN